MDEKNTIDSIKNQNGVCCVEYEAFFILKNVFICETMEKIVYLWHYGKMCLFVKLSNQERF